jgi:hypothetical protein
MLNATTKYHIAQRDTYPPITHLSTLQITKLLAYVVIVSGNQNALRSLKTVQAWRKRLKRVKSGEANMFGVRWKGRRFLPPVHKYLDSCGKPQVEYRLTLKGHHKCVATKYNEHP